MQKLTMHLNFNGNCEAAFKYYEKHLGGKITFVMPWGDSPMAKETPKGWEKKIMHASFEVEGCQIIAADSPPGKYEKPQGMAVCLNYTKPEDADRAFKALSEGGRVQMTIQETFFAHRFGMAVDQFGTPWMVHCGKSR
jgi:PhnB protein